MNPALDPESVVQRQLEAYHARDVNALLASMRTTPASSNILPTCSRKVQPNCGSALRLGSRNPICTPRFADGS